jgi:hypothetical protein
MPMRLGLGSQRALSCFNVEKFRKAGSEMMHVANAFITNKKIIDYEGKYNIASAVTEQTGG